jgi:hypothetical protein
MCGHRLQLQLPLPLSLKPFCSLDMQWIYNGRARSQISDGGKQVVKTSGWSVSASNAGCEAGDNAAS